MADASVPVVDLSLKAVLKDSTDQMMNLVENRVATFDRWPLRGSSACSPRRMAEAGFYHCPTETDPDLARCYVCYEELGDWEPGDDPFQEHSRSVDCAFVALGMKEEKDITVREFLHLETDRQKNRISKLKRLLAADREELLRKTKLELNKQKRKFRR
ncbi:hypothetical protein HPB50_000922 [Hyalomma asiaticum]|uniref:Uncharacterized protein n=1 Tax=Hyalomma asiaticum TaxID=266040 RepID=A0ACB7SDI5_HYAAI|nr:hypothetical protein HPB50_000922 [Hyalomma asiaticum]